MGADDSQMKSNVNVIIDMNIDDDDPASSSQPSVPRSPLIFSLLRLFIGMLFLLASQAYP